MVHRLEYTSYVSIMYSNVLCFLIMQYTPGKYEISRREGRCILKLKNPSPEDDGAEFACEVEGDRTVCKLKVDGKRKANVRTSILIYFDCAKAGRNSIADSKIDTFYSLSKKYLP